jgi:hypothetical protein
MDTSKQDLSAVKVILAAIEEWKRVADKYGSNSKESQQCGSKAIILLCRHAKTLNDFQRRFNANVDTPGIISGLIDMANVFTLDELKNRGDEDDYYTFAQEDFIADLKRWTQQPLDGNVTLKQFMELYCNLHKNSDLISRREAIYKAVKRELIKLPRPTRRPIRGKSNVYNAGHLKAKWNEFSRQVELPPLISH